MSWVHVMAGLVAALLFFWGAGVRARLNGLRKHLEMSLQQLDQQIRQRHAMLEPFLSTTAPEGSAYQAALAKVMGARAQVNAAYALTQARHPLPSALRSLRMAEDIFQDAMLNLLVHVPAQMQIKSDQGDDHWTPFTEAWQEADKRVSYAMQVLNEQVGAFNQALHQWPTRAVTYWLGFRPLPTL